MHSSRFQTLLARGCAAALLVLAWPGMAAVRDSASAEALGDRMQAAEARFSRAVVGVRNDDPAAQRESDAALDDMEDVVAACIRTRGCPVSSMLASYKRLLKQSVDLDADDDADVEPAAGSLGHQSMAANVPEAAHAANLLSQDHRFDRMVEYNPAVQQGIRRWLTDLRGPLLSSYENYEYMRYLMWPEYERAGLPEALLFGIMAKESNGKVHASSRTGAAGLMQFMPATGRRFGLGPDGSGFDTRYDPRSSAEASAAYLNERMRELNHNIELSLAAYNGGEGRALRVYQGGNAGSFWNESVYNQFPAETRDYVPMVIAAAWLFLHPKEYGLTLPRVSNRPAPLRLTQPASIYQLTMCLGNRGVREGYMRALRNLNPRYEPQTYLSAGTTLNATTRIVGLYSRWCVSGARADLARMLAVSDPSRAVVRTGTLQPVATFDNGDGQGGGISGDSTTPVPVAAPDAQTSVSSPTFAPGTARRGSPAVPSASGRAPPASYRVQEGETLETVAHKFGCAVDDLAADNGLGPSASVHRGQMLRLGRCKG